MSIEDQRLFNLHLFNGGRMLWLKNIKMERIFQVCYPVANVIVSRFLDVAFLGEYNALIGST